MYCAAARVYSGESDSRKKALQQDRKKALLAEPAGKNLESTMAIGNLDSFKEASGTHTATDAHGDDGVLAAAAT